MIWGVSRFEKHIRRFGWHLNGNEKLRGVKIIFAGLVYNANEVVFSGAFIW
jgi:hypothetical protein